MENSISLRRSVPTIRCLNFTICCSVTAAIRKVIKSRQYETVVKDHYRCILISIDFCPACLFLSKQGKAPRAAARSNIP